MAMYNNLSAMEAFVAHHTAFVFMAMYNNLTSGQAFVFMAMYNNLSDMEPFLYICVPLRPLSLGYSHAGLCLNEYVEKSVTHGVLCLYDFV